MKKFFLCLLTILVPFSAFSEQSGPNILFILSDDQRWDSLGCYGNVSIRTPNLDKLAKEGALLSSFYSIAPVCCPSRVALLTGLYPHQSGVYGNHGQSKFTAQTVASYLNSAGYLTAFIGKAHPMESPRNWGFQVVPVYFRGASANTEDGRLVVNGKRELVKGLVTEAFANAAIKFLDDNKQQKWFLWLATSAPHGPLIKNTSYKASELKPPPGWPKSNKFIGEEWVDYYETISSLDTQIGRILKKLEELELLDKTLVFFTSDNGRMNGSHGRQGKAIWYEESTHLPAIVRWPGKIQPNTRTSTLLSTVDFVPTVLEAAGVRPEKNLPGKSILPVVVSGEKRSNVIFSEVGGRPENMELWRMIRTDRWKYVRVYTPGSKNEGDLLYDLHEDPDEMRNLAGSGDRATILNELKAQFEDWLKNTQPVLPFGDLKKQKSKNKKQNTTTEEDEDSSD